MDVMELLTALGWPTKHVDQQGTVIWQKPMTASSLPPTATLSVTSKTVKASVLNIATSSVLTPHLQAEWDISTPVPMLKKCVQGGHDVLSSYPTRLVEERAVQDFCSSVALLNTFPVLNFSGPRQSAKLPDLSA